MSNEKIEVQPECPDWALDCRSDLSLAQRLYIEQWPDTPDMGEARGTYAIYDRHHTGTDVDYHGMKVCGIETRKEAEEIRAKMIRGESLRDEEGQE